MAEDCSQCRPNSRRNVVYIKKCLASQAALLFSPLHCRGFTNINEDVSVTAPENLMTICCFLFHLKFTFPKEFQKNY